MVPQSLNTATCVPFLGDIVKQALLLIEVLQFVRLKESALHSCPPGFIAIERLTSGRGDIRRHVLTTDILNTRTKNVSLVCFNDSYNDCQPGAFPKALMSSSNQFLVFGADWR